MPMNLPTTTVRNYSYGTGKLYLGPTGSEPTEEVGVVKSGASLVVTREKITVEAGSPLQIIDEKVIRERAVFSFVGIEWNFKRLVQALGAGECSYEAGAGVCTRIRFGGDSDITHYALKFLHRTPLGDCIFIRLWECIPMTEMSMIFNEDAYQEFPQSYTAKNATTDWDSVALGDKEQLYELERIFAPS